MYIFITSPYSVKKCNQTIPNGRFQSDCSGYLGTTCRYQCSPGYLPALADLDLHCSYNGDWGVQMDKLCEYHLNIHLTECKLRSEYMYISRLSCDNEAVSDFFLKF